MLYNQDLENLIINRHNLNNADNLLIISGYLGAAPIYAISQQPIHTTVVYGMFRSAGISDRLHSTLLGLHNNNLNLNILYSNIEVHSKCYIWLRNNQIVDVLIGSANFSTSGLNNPLREILSEVTLNFETLDRLNMYITSILNDSIPCNQATPCFATTVNNAASYSVNQPLINNTLSASTCLLSFIGRGNRVPLQGAINWFNSDGNVTPGDGYIAIKAEYVRNYPNLFPPKSLAPSSPHNGREQRHNDAIDVIWDDGTPMPCLLEGSQDISGLIGKYPKNFASSPRKHILGIYIRNRMGLAHNHVITEQDLINYGRTDIALTSMPDGTYYADFSV